MTDTHPARTSRYTSNSGPHVLLRETGPQIACLAALFSPALLGPTASHAATRYYADTCYERESGDIAGVIVAVTDHAPEPDVTFTWSEGALVAPRHATVLATSRPDHALSFTASAPGDADHARFIITFRGHYARGDLIGTITGLPGDARTRSVTLERRSRDAADDPRAHVGVGPCGPASP